MMKELWKQRQKQHVIQMMKYIKYVFNDHFTIVLMVAFGFLATYYAQFLTTATTQTLKHPFVFIIVTLIWTICSQAFRLAVLFKPADEHFLMPLEHELPSYLQKTYQYSFILPIFAVLALWAIHLPLFHLLEFRQPIFFIGLALSQVGIRFHYQLYSMRHQQQPTVSSLFYIVTFLLMYSSFQFSIYLPLAISVVLFIFSYRLAFYQQGRFRWQWVIQEEIKRQNRLYRIIQLFIDVPILEERMKSRHYLQHFFTRKSTMSLFLMERIFIRSSYYLGLVVRLMCFSIVLMLIIPSIYHLAITILLAYVTAFQLLALYAHHKDTLQLMALPQRKLEKDKAFIALVRRILLMQLSIVHFVTVIVYQDIWVLVSWLGSSLFMATILALYIQRKIDRID